MHTHRRIQHDTKTAPHQKTATALQHLRPAPRDLLTLETSRGIWSGSIFPKCPNPRTGSRQIEKGCVDDASSAASPTHQGPPPPPFSSPGLSHSQTKSRFLPLPAFAFKSAKTCSFLVTCSRRASMMREGTFESTRPHHRQRVNMPCHGVRVSSSRCRELTVNLSTAGALD